MDFSEALKDTFDRLVINSATLTPEQKKKMLEGVNDNLIEKPPVFFPFDKQSVLEAELIGNAPDYNHEGQKVTCWLFKDTEGNTYHVPKYNQLNKPQDKFQGFDNEKPGVYYYKIVFLGEQQLPGNGYEYQFKIFRKEIIK